MIPQAVMLILLIPIGIITLVYLLRRPEITFALFLFSYVIEGGVARPWFLNLTLILLAIMILGFAAQLAAGKKSNFKIRAVDLWLFGFIFVLFAGSYLVPSIAGGLNKAIRFTVAVFLSSYLMARIFLTERAQIHRFLKTILISSSVVCIMLIILAIREGVVGRVPFFAANPIPVGTFFAVGMCLAVIEAMMPSKREWKLNRVLCVAIIPVFLYGIFLTGVRGPLIAAVAGLSLYFFIGFARRITPKFRAVSVVALLLAITGFYYYGDRLPNIEAFSPMAIRKGLSTIHRLEQVALVRDLFLQSPLLGVGTDGFNQLTDWGYPHNIFLEVAVENGLIGLIFFGAFLVAVARYGFRFLTFYYRRSTKLTQKMGLMILTVSVVLLVGRQFSFGLDMHRDLFVFLALIVNLSAITQLELNSSQKRLID